MAEKDYVSVKREEVKPIPEKWFKQIRLFMRIVTRVHVWLLRKSGGRLLRHWPGSDAEICIVSTRGRRSGKTREVALIHLPWQDKKLLVASQGGMEQHPLWYHNIRANPDISIAVNGRQQRYFARQASDEEKRALWPQLLSIYPDFDEYQARTDRDIPVLICEPVDEA